MLLRTSSRPPFRIVAARILGQQAQVTRRRTDFFQAVRRLEDIREESRKKYQAAGVARSPAPKPERARKTAGAKPKLTPKTSPPEEDIDPGAWKTSADYMRLRRAQLKR